MQQFEYDVYSQNGEDGVICHILKCLNRSRDGHCCEFGAHDGTHLSNTFYLVQSFGYKAVYIESDSIRYEALTQTAKHHLSIHPIQATVTEHNLDSILLLTDLPQDFDVLSIDVDGPDLQIWRGLTTFRPKVVIIEIESSLPPGLLKEHTADSELPGSSFSSTLRLAEEKGYTFLHHTGNMIFIADEHKHLIKCPDDPGHHFNRRWCS